MQKFKNPVWAEYIWIDGQETGKLRSKAQRIENPGNWSRELKGFNDHEIDISKIPKWGFDGSSTYQAEGHFSDCGLKPVYAVPDPIRGGQNILVLCEVTSADGTPHKTNTRHKLVKVLTKNLHQEPWAGIEQEYTLYGANGRPFGWPKDGGLPEGQGKYYCGVGFDEVHGRPLVEAHMQACELAGLSISGINAEVMPSQWEFQVGPHDPLETADQLWIARWLLYRIGEDYCAYAKLDPKPMSGDWNGAGGHVNFSTKSMREEGGIILIREACEKLSKFHIEHMAVYGVDNEKRLTGKHETCSYKQFRFGVSNRGASIRIPMNTANSKRGYLEDRRPAANLDPYKVLTALMETICGDGFNPKKFGWEPDLVVPNYEILSEKNAEIPTAQPTI